MNSSPPDSAVVDRSEIPISERLIVALDLYDEGETLALVDELGDLVDFYKVGYRGVFNGGLGFVEKLIRDRGKKVFLDLKFFDVPETTAENVRRAADAGVTFATVHGNGASIAEAKRRTEGTDLKILAVTLLTSLNRDDVNAIYGIDHPVDETVLRMAKYLVEQGCDGVIASPREAKRLRAEIEGLLVVTPGIRDGDSSNDHQRVGTSRQAIGDGAEYIVVGRPIYQASEPRAAARRYLEGIAEGLRERA